MKNSVTAGLNIVKCHPSCVCSYSEMGPSHFCAALIHFNVVVDVCWHMGCSLVVKGEDQRAQCSLPLVRDETI
jgi:hypothetical protein